jgi:osmoprotectant transport system permease protein
MMLASVGSSFSDALDFLFHQRDSVAGGVKVGGAKLLPLIGTHVKISAIAMAIACAIAVPLGLWLGHTGRGAFLATTTASVGRAVPSFALIAFFLAYLGPSFANVTLALVLLAIPPILQNTYVGIREVDPELVDAARGMGMRASEVVRRVEAPLAVPSIFGGIRTSAVNVVATATLGSFAGVVTLGDPIFNANVYGDAGRLGGALLVAVLAIAAELLFAGLQRLATPVGLRAAATPGRRHRTLLVRPAPTD